MKKKECGNDWCDGPVEGEGSRFCEVCKSTQEENAKLPKCGKGWCSSKRRCVDCQQIERAKEASKDIEIPEGLSTLEKSTAAFLILCQQYEQMGKQLSCLAMGLNELRMERGLGAC